MRKAILFLVLAFGVFATAEAQKSPMQKEVLELYRHASLCKTQSDFANVAVEGEAYLKNNPDSPDRYRVIYLLAKTYRCFGKNEESVRYYKIVKESIPLMDPQQIRDIWDDRSAFDKFINEANQFIESVQNPKPQSGSKTAPEQNNTVSTSLLGLSAEQLVERYGKPESIIKERVKREKSVVGLGLSEVLRSPEFIYDNVFKFKRSTDSGNGGYILITCGLLNGKTVFIEYEDYDNPFYKGKAGSFDQDAMYLLIGKNLNTPTLKPTYSIKEDDRFKYYIEQRSGSIVATQESSVTKSTAWIAIFSDEGWQAYRKFIMEYNNSGLNNI